MLHCVPAALNKQSYTAFISMIVTKPIRIFNSISPVTQTADTYMYFAGLLEMPLLQRPIPVTQQTMVRRRQEHHFSSRINARSPLPVGTGDCLSSPPRSTRGARTAVLMLQGGQTPAAMRQRKVASTWPGEPALAKQKHNVHDF